jgi:hypothetical protein
MNKNILTVAIISLALIGLYFLFSPYQNCKRDYVDEWLNSEEAKGKYVSNLDVKDRLEFCVINSSW